MNTLEIIRQPILAEIEEYRKLFESTLYNRNELLNSVLSYIGQRKGKMMRPLLVLLMAREAGTISAASFHSAVTLELLHTASLVHDDIVDESDERRGQASVNAVFDNKMAVLVGDYLLSSALEQASFSGDIRIVQKISSLGKSLSEGEMLQLSNIQNETFTEEAYLAVINQKTAALFAASAELGALSVGASDEFIEKAYKFGQIVGICFQIKDDIFDYSVSSEIGKPTGNDMLEGKLTLPAIYVLNTTQNEEMLALAAKIKEGVATDSEIAKLVDFTKRNGGIEYAEQVMERYCEQGMELLSDFKDVEVKRSLTEYLNFVVGRTM
ncbi:MAG: polyprenyl synthetase family protein [Bacteroidaceae bacterium]